MKIKKNNIIRFFIFLSLLLYTFGLIFAHNTYLAWQDYIPFFSKPNNILFNLLVQILFITLASISIPLQIKKPSEIFSWVFLLFLYIPIFVFFLGETKTLNEETILTIFALFLSFLLITTSVLFIKKPEATNTNIALPLLTPLVIFWIFLLILLLVKFSTVMSFRGLDTIYEQRILGKANSLLYGYAQIYFGYVVSIALFSLGLFYKKPILVIIGITGSIILYSITAERTIFILPAFVYILFKLTSSHKKHYKALILFTALSAIYFFIIGIYGDSSKIAKDLGFYYLTRVVSVPGLFFNDYLLYFQEKGFTYFTHAKGFDFFLEATPSLKNDPFYPELGRIIARDVHGINSNSNASFLATDGIAGLGLIGVILISTLLSITLILIDNLTKIWPSSIIVPIMGPMALTLTNGSFFTVFISFGMLFWILIFLLFKIKHMPLKS